MKNYLILFICAIGLYYSCVSNNENEEGTESIPENFSKSLTENSAIDKTKEILESQVPNLRIEEKLSYDGQAFNLILDDITPVFNYHSQPVVIDDKRKIMWYNQRNNSLDFYDLTTKEIDKSLKFEINGPNSLPGMGLGAGVNYVNSDTIILFSGQINLIYLSNLSGKIYKKYRS